MLWSDAICTVQFAHCEHCAIDDSTNSTTNFLRLPRVLLNLKAAFFSFLLLPLLPIFFCWLRLGITPVTVFGETGVQWARYRFYTLFRGLAPWHWRAYGRIHPTLNLIRFIEVDTHTQTFKHRFNSAGANPRPEQPLCWCKIRLEGPRPRHGSVWSKGLRKAFICEPVQAICWHCWDSILFTTSFFSSPSSFLIPFLSLSLSFVFPYLVCFCVCVFNANPNCEPTRWARHLGQMGLWWQPGSPLSHGCLPRHTPCFTFPLVPPTAHSNGTRWNGNQSPERLIRFDYLKIIYFPNQHGRTRRMRKWSNPGETGRTGWPRDGLMGALL